MLKGVTYKSRFVGPWWGMATLSLGLVIAMLASLNMLIVGEFMAVPLAFIPHSAGMLAWLSGAFVVLVVWAWNTFFFKVTTGEQAVQLLQRQWFWYGALLATVAASSWSVLTALEWSPVATQGAFWGLQTCLAAVLCRVQVQTVKAERYLRTLAEE